jgi:hypothetical protein
MTTDRKYCNDWVLYFHRNKDTEEVFYVGIGALKRSWDFSGRNFLWKSYVSKHGNPIVEIYKSNLTFLEAQYLECYFILQNGRKINNTGVLVNLSAGGEGARGAIRTKESINKRIETIKRNGKPVKKGKDHKNFGRVIDEEWRRKLSESGKKRRLTQEHKDKIGEAGKKRKLSSIQKEALLNANKGKVHTAEHNKKIGEMAKQIWADPVYKEKMRVKALGKIRNAKKVINTKTGVIYNSCKDAAELTGVGASYLRAMLGGHFNNKTDCKYL